MRAYVIASREEVAGFALSGVDGAVVSTRDDVERALSEIPLDDTLLILGSVAVAAIDERVSAWERSGKGPMYVVLPA